MWNKNWNKKIGTKKLEQKGHTFYIHIHMYPKWEEKEKKKEKEEDA